MRFHAVRTRSVAPAIAALALVGGGVVVQVATTTASAATPVTTEAEFRNAWANDAEVVLGANIDLTCVSQAGPGESQAERDVAGDGVLDGQGFTITQTCPENRVLHIVGDTGHTTIQNVTITGGESVFSAGDGGGNGGGGIQSAVETGLTVIDSTFTGNATCEGGGGIEMDYSGELAVSGSTFTNNVADYGGALTTYKGGSISMLNSTVTDNSAVGDAGGISTYGADLTLVYTDVTNNAIGAVVPLDCEAGSNAVGSADVHAADLAAADNLYVDGTFHTFANIVAQPAGGNDNCSIASGDSAGYNYADDTSCTFDDATDNAASTNDPMLGTLADNGGPTQTLLPETGSPVIDAIPHVSCGNGDDLVQTVVLSDQRDFGRPEVSGGNCDIGAVEVQPTPPTPPPPAPPTPSPAVIVTPRFTG